MDRVFKAFLEKQTEEALALAKESDILKLALLGPPPVQHFVARFFCRGLVRDPSGSISEAGEFVIGIKLSDDYLRRAVVPEVVTLLHPVNLFAPNCRFPWICTGHLVPGLPLVALLFQIYEIITFHKFTLTDALNPEACEYVRANFQRFPLDRRSLRRPAQAGGGSLPAPTTL